MSARNVDRYVRALRNQIGRLHVPDAPTDLPSLNLSILDVMTEPALFGDEFGGDSWRPWRVFLAGLFGLSLDDADLETFYRHTEREPPAYPVREGWVIVGRRGGKSRIAALVVGFDHHTRFVWSDDPTALDTLDAQVKQGGEPIGMTVAYEDHATYRPLAEYVGEEWVEKYLLTLMAHFRNVARDHGIETGPFMT